MFDKMKALMEMQKKMQEVKRQLDETTFDVEGPRGLVKLTMNGSQELKEVKVQTDLKAVEPAHLEQSIKEAFNKAIKRSQSIAAEKMKEVTGIKLPGLG